MHEETDNQNNQEQQPEETKKPRKRKKKSFFTRVFQISAIIFTLIILLLIGVFIFIQTNTFNKIALNFTLTKLNESWLNKESIMTADSIYGNILSGIELKHGSISVKGDTMVSYSSILLDYDLWGLLSQDINLKKLIINEPQFNLVEVKGKNDSLVWNVIYLFSSDEVDTDTTESPFEWDVNVQNLELHNGTAKIYNRKDPSIPLSRIQFSRQEQFALSDLEITNLNMALDAKYFLKQKEIHIKEFNFNTNSDVYVKKLTMDVLIDETANTTALTNMVLQTTRSNIYMNTVSMDNFNPFKQINYELFKDNNVKIDLVTDKFDFKDLKFFFPAVDFLDSTVYLDLKAEGKYSNLFISKLELKTPSGSFYNFAGRVENLHEPSKMLYDITASNMEIDPRDTKVILPGLPIPDYSYLGKVSIPYLTYKGEATRFNTEFDVRSTAGNTSGDMFLDFNQPYMVYKGDVSARNLNIGRIIRDNSLESNINADVNVDGRGTDFNTMDIKVNYDVNGSRFFGQNIVKSNGQVSLNRGTAVLDVIYISSGVNAKVAGKVSNLSNTDNLTYNLKGYSKNLDISSFTKDASQKSNLNFTFDINGRGTNPDNITGKFDFNINRSLFADFIIPQTPLKATLQGGSGNRVIDVDSDILEFNASGQFSISALSEVITSNMEEITAEITKLSSREDTLYTDTLTAVLTPVNNLAGGDLSLSSGFSAPLNVAPDVNMRYTLSIKNLTPIASYTDTALTIKADIRGAIISQSNNFRMTADADIADLRYGDSLLILQDGRLNFSLANNPVTPGLEGFNSNLSFYTDSILIAGNKFDSLNTYFNFVDYSNNYRISARSDTTYIVAANGMFDFFREKIRVTFDSLKFNYANYNITNRGDLAVSYVQQEGAQGIDFEQFELASGIQRIDIKGKYAFDTVSNLNISADNISIAELQKFNNPSIKDEELITGNLRRVEIDFKGTQQNPEVYAEINTDPFTVEGNSLGRFDAIIEYKENNLHPDISFFNANNEGNLKIYGNIPLENPLIADTTGASFTIANKLVDLKLNANNFQFAFLSQFVPSVSDLRGNLNGKLNITGSVSQPLLNGGLTIRNTNFTLDMTNMYYGFNADLTTENQKLIVTGSKLFDPDEDSRFITTTGYIDFTDLTLNDIQLNMTGDVRVFDRGNDPTAFGIYGDLIAGSGNPGLKLSGNSEMLELTGNLILKSGNLIMNPTGNAAYDIYGDDFVYTVSVDSSNMSDSMLAALKTEIGKLKDKKYSDLTPFEKLLVPENAPTDSVVAEPSLFIYDVHITSERDIYLRFIVNERTKQEFFGNVNTDLYVDNRNENQMSAYGTVELGDDAYYRFYKRFDASGTLEFTGEVANPKLNVNAEYISRSVGTNDPAAEADEYKVILKVTGRAQKPDIAFSVTKNGTPIGGSDPTSEAMSLVLFGRPLDAGTQSSVITSIGANVGSIFVADYLSNVIQQALPFIVNTDLNYVDSRDGSIAQNTDLTLTAEFGDAIVKVGGQVFQGIDNANIIAQYPLNRVLKIEGIGNNLILQVERVVDPFSGTNLERDTRDTRTGALIYYRIKF